jgi:hypothetical protein
MIQEALLQFIWQYNLYNPFGLRTNKGEPIQVIHPGTINRDAGPDFSMARVRIGDTLLIGNIEHHVRTSDWARHQHDGNPAYSKVILHVVYEHDSDMLNSSIPILQLKEHIPLEVLDRYSNLIQTTAPLPCATALQRVNDITRTSWLSRMLVERWEQKLGIWNDELQLAGGDWHTLFWWRLAANFGFKVNAAPFLMLAQSLPIKIILKQSSLFAVEALLFGQSGMLNAGFSDEYPLSLQKEYTYFKDKYSLQSIQPELWKFLRLRPANFPTLRIAQLAAILHTVPQLFTTISGDKGVEALSKSLSVTASDYWKSHYRFGEPQVKASTKSLGSDAVQNIIINTIAPIRFLYAHTHSRPQEAEAALQLLESIPAEDNKITRVWEGNGWKPLNAGNSQSMIQLFNQYCAGKRCLECAVGLSIIRSRPDK